MAPFFEARSVAVFGVSPLPGNLGRRIVENLREFGFRGDIVPVGPRGGEVTGLAIVPSLREASVRVELAVLLVPASQVLPALEECGRAGVRAVVISSGGFSEYEAARQALDGQVLEAARRYGVRVMGPNCIGVIHLERGLCLPFAPLRRRDFLPGPHSVISQSGGVMLQVAALLSEERLGVRILLSEGNKLDLDEAELLPYLAEDPGTRVIFLYLEGIGRGRELLEAARRSAKPVVALKANVAEASAAIARSHTAALASDDRVLDAAFRQAGILRVRELGQFVLCAKAFALPALRGENLAVASMSGGVSVLAADACARWGFRLPSLPRGLLEEIERRGRGGVIRLGNPLDLGDIYDPNAVLLLMEGLLALAEIDGVALCLPSPGAVGRMLAGGPGPGELARRLRALMERHRKPVAVSFFGGRGEAEPLLEEGAGPIFWSVTESIEALALQRAFWRRRGRSFAPGDPRAGPGRGALRARLRAGSPRPPLVEALAVLASAGLPVEEIRPATTPREAAAVAEALGFPVALKLLSPELSHKSEVGGVALGLGTREAVEAAFRRIVESARARAPGARLSGVGVQRMLTGGHEVIVGAKRDPAFGPVVLFGLGGVWVEALQDVSLRLAPIDREEALEMVGEIRGASLLRGGRGSPPADLDALVDLLRSVSRLVEEAPEIRELDLNPVMVWERGVRILDARMALEAEAAPAAGGSRA